MTARESRKRPQSIAALLWLSTAFAPAEKTAAMKRPSRDKHPVPDGVDASIELVKAAYGHVVLDRAPAEAELAQLPDRDHTVLRPRQSGDGPITWAGFGRNISPDPAQVVHASDGGGALVKDQHTL